jgi:4-amino-4-deoxy-L-arabinose transferase-like glycosyltransferase
MRRNLKQRLRHGKSGWSLLLFFLKEIKTFMKLRKEFISSKSFFFLLSGVAILVLCANLGLPPLWGSEGRWAVIARSMLQSGNLLYPALGTMGYWDKPLFSYWQILPFAFVLGDVSEFTIRFPSVVWALVMLLLTYSLAKRWFGEQTALLSMGILATSYGFVFWGRNAQVEMTNAAMILLCLWYFLRHKSDSKHTWVYLLGIMMGLGANMKGPVLYAVPVFGIVLLSIIKREWSWIPPLRVLVTATLLSIAVFLAVPVVGSVHAATWEPLHMVWRENVLRFFGLYDHRGSFFTYFITVFCLAAPWSLFLPAAVARSVQTARSRLSQIPEVLILFGAIFLFFNLSGSKRSYYLLPILPFSAILVANLLREFATHMLGRVLQGVVKGVGILLGFALIAMFGIFLLFPQMFPAGARALGSASALVALLGAAMITSATRKYVWGMIGSVIAACLVYVIGVTPLIAEGPNLKTRIAQVNALRRPCGLLNVSNAKLRFYLGKPYQVFCDEAHALEWATQVDGVLITSSPVSEQNWESVMKGHHWQAVIPRKGHPLEQVQSIPDS